MIRPHSQNHISKLISFGGQNKKNLIMQFCSLGITVEESNCRTLVIHKISDQEYSKTFSAKQTQFSSIVG